MDSHLLELARCRRSFSRFHGLQRRGQLARRNCASLPDQFQTGERETRNHWIIARIQAFGLQVFGWSISWRPAARPPNLTNTPPLVRQKRTPHAATKATSSSPFSKVAQFISSQITLLKIRTFIFAVFSAMFRIAPTLDASQQLQPRQTAAAQPARSRPRPQTRIVITAGVEHRESTSLQAPWRAWALAALAAAQLAAGHLVSHSLGGAVCRRTAPGRQHAADTCTHRGLTAHPFPAPCRRCPLRRWPALPTSRSTCVPLTTTQRSSTSKQRLRA